MDELLFRAFPRFIFNSEGKELLEPLYLKITSCKNWTQTKIRWDFPGEISKMILSHLKDVAPEDYGVVIFLLLVDMMLKESVFKDPRKTTIDKYCLRSIIRQDEEMHKVYKYMLKIAI